MIPAGWRRRRDHRRGPAPPDSEARRRFFDQAQALTRYLSVEVGELTFLVDTSDRIGRGLFVRRFRQDLRHLDRAVRLVGEHRLLREGSIFVDVGANIGTTTVHAVRCHGFAGAVSLEPAPTNFRLLLLNLVANEVEGRVRPLRAAAADREGTVQLVLSRRTSGEHSIVARSDGKASRTIAAQAVTLDALAAGGLLDPAAVGLLWMDAQGAEHLVLAGAATLLARGVPVATAVRPKLANWLETRDGLIRLLAGYTHFYDLRRRVAPAAHALAPLLDAQEASGDLLALRVPDEEPPHARVR